MTDETPYGDARGAVRGTPAAIRDIIERTLLVGLGAAALTMERVQAVADEFVRRGQLSKEEGRQLVDDMASRSRGEARSVLRTADSGLQSAYRELGISTRREAEDLDFRIRQLEHRVHLLERKVDTEVDYDSGV